MLKKNKNKSINKSFVLIVLLLICGLLLSVFSVNFNKNISKPDNNMQEDNISKFNPFILISENENILYGSAVYADGEKICYPKDDNNRYVLNKDTFSWEIEEIESSIGLIRIYKSCVWTDGEREYKTIITYTLSVPGATPYAVSQSSYTRTDYFRLIGSLEWNICNFIYPEDYNLSSCFLPEDFWFDGENVFYLNNYSVPNTNFILNKETLTWEPFEFIGFNNLDVNNIWTVSENIYYSNGFEHYIYNKNAFSWENVSFHGIDNFYVSNIWTDGKYTYCYYNEEQYILDEESCSWIVLDWSFPVSTSEYLSLASCVWTDGQNCYFTYEGKTYKFNGIN